MLCDIRKKFDDLRENATIGGSSTNGSSSGNPSNSTDGSSSGNPKDKESFSQKLSKALDPVKKVIDDAEKSVKNFIEKTKQKMNNKKEVSSKAVINKTKQKQNLTDSEGHDIQDAQNDIKWDTMTPLKVVYTSTQPMNPATYSNSEDYPTKVGEIDEKKNFITKNFTTGEWWRVHHTGYYQKVDGVGNFEEKIPGTAFYYNFGDIQKSIEGNVDKIMMQNYYTYTMGIKTEDIDGDHFLNNNSNIIINTLIAHLEAIGLNRTIKVGGNSLTDVGGNITIKAGGNITIEAGGQITLKGAKINLN